MGLDLVQARRQAKELLRAAKSGDSEALSRFRADRPPRLADAQAAVARKLGFRSWPALLRGVLQAAVEDGQLERLRALMADGVSVRGSDLLLDARDPDVTTAPKHRRPSAPRSGTLQKRAEPAAARRCRWSGTP